MKALLLLSALVLAQGGAIFPPAPQRGQVSTIRGSIQGTVRAANSSDGIPDVEITMASSLAPGVPRTSRTTTTDAEGRFSFTDVPVGRFGLRAQRAGFFPPSGSSPLAAAVTTSAEVRPDAPNATVAITMVPGGIISGRLTDTEGRPVVGIRVAALSVSYADGRKTLTVTARPFVANVATNDLGDYRLFWFAPGEYYVRAEPAALNRSRSASTVVLPTFYPGTTDQSHGLPIKVNAGQETGGIDFRVEMAEAFKVSGKVTLSVPLPPSQPAVASNGLLGNRRISSFYVVPQDAEPGEQIPLTRNSLFTPGPDKTTFDFELRGIAPGRYFVYPLFMERQSGSFGFGAAGRPISYSARIPVEVIDKDVTGLAGDIHPYPDLTVHFTLTGDPLLKALRLVTPRIQLRPQETLGPLLAPPTGFGGAANATDGSFVFQNVFPAKYSLQVSRLPPNYYLADIRQGTTSLYDDPAFNTTEEPSPPIEIKLSTGGGLIRGVLRDKTGAPATGRITLVPQGPRHENRSLYKRATADPYTGQFEIPAIAPCEYKIFAWETLPAGADENAEFLAKYEAQARVVSVVGNTMITELNITLISKEKP